MGAQIQRLNRTKSWSETQLKELAEKDRKRAMHIVIQKYREALLYHAVCIVRDQDEAYDLVQEVFIRAIREERLFFQDFRIKAWLYRVTSNLCFNNVRNKKRRSAILNAAKMSDRSDADQISDIFADERQTEILKAISTLSEEHQKILMFRYYDDLSYKELSDVLQLRLGTVMSRLSRARTKLFEILDPDLLKS
jgi:RNA polymerase sigma-70 factor (ECF subfamily)